jgi:hypothetical protein
MVVIFVAVAWTITPRSRGIRSEAFARISAITSLKNCQDGS